MSKQAVIYARYSPRPNAKDCDSCARQAERCRVYCKQHKYEIFGYYDDNAITGGKLDRSGLSCAIGALEPTQVLVVDSSDRLARDMLVNLTIRQQVEQAGATIEFADGSPHDTTPEGKLFQNILAAFAAYERDRIRLRTKQGLDRKRKNGERTTGQIPIGWQKDPEDPKRLVRCRKEREAILEACYWKSVHQTSGNIAKRLDLIFGPCRGKPWSARTVRKIIKREAFWAGPDGDLGLEPTHP